MEREQFNKYIRSSNQLNEESLGLLKEVTEDYPWFQTGWMLYLMNLKKLNHPDFEPTLKQVAIMVPNRKRLYKFLNNELSLSGMPAFQSTSFSDYNLENNAPPKSDALIDRFLSSKPGVIRSPHTGDESKKESDNKHIIEKSISESDDLITETLANIYVQQKNYDKALVAFQKLSLKYPEKSIYFASRIKEIEAIKNNI